jgi:hypothetical protein
MVPLPTFGGIMKKLLIVSALLAVTASSAMAEGINLSWTDCGSFGAANQTFACNSNSGAGFALVCSFVSPIPMDMFLGISGRVDLRSQSATLPDWWAHGTGTCRGTTALSSSFDFSTSTFNCNDVWQGQAVGGYLYQVGGTVGLAGPDRANLLVQCAVPLDAPIQIDDATEHYGVRFTFTRAKTTGTGSCTGCATPVCIVLNEMQLFQPDDLNASPKVFTPINSNFVTWQTTPGADCPAATPAKSSSWGQVKSLYR